MQTIPKVYNVVWFMDDNKVVSHKVFAVTQTASRDKVTLNIVIRIDMGNEEKDIISKKLPDIFNTKKELMQAVFGLPISRVSQAEQCCIDIAYDFDANEITKQTTSIQFAWKLGTELHKSMEYNDD